MTIEEYVFKIEQGYILLEDLEDWYSRDIVTYNDSVQIFDKNWKYIIITIRTLVKRYGSKSPFRKIRLSDFADLTHFYTSEELLSIRKDPSVKKMRFNCDTCVMERCDKPPDVGPTDHMKSCITYVDYPLLNVKNEPDEDRITGQEVIDEIQKLKDFLPEITRNENFENHFSFLKRVDINKMTVCHLCDFASWSPYMFFNHVFSQKHAEQLSKHWISRNSFKYWMDQFEEMGFNNNTLENNCTEEQTPEQMQNFEDSEKNDEISQESEQTSESTQITPFETQNAPQQWAEGPMNYQMDNSEYAEQQQFMSEKPIWGYQNYGYYVPMLSVPLGPTLMVCQQELTKVIRSMNIWLQNTGKEQASRIIVNWNCQFCGVILPTELDAFYHITSMEHLTMINFTTPLGDLNYWKEWIIRINQGAPIMFQNEHPMNVIEPEVINVPEFEPQTPEHVGIGSSDYYVPRAPMLDKIPSDSEIFQPVNIEAYLAMWSTSFTCGGEIANNKAKNQHVQWTCSFCSTSSKPIKLSNMLYAFNHIFQNKHWEMMNFTTRTADVEFWTDWIQSINPTTTVPSKSPRIPLLSATPPGEEPIIKSEFNRILDECEKFVKLRKHRLPTGNRLTGSCAFCPDSGFLKNTFLIFEHILSKKHREKVQCRASNSDMRFWTNFVQIVYEKPPNYTPYNRLRMRPKNNPRVPLIDTPAFNNLLAEKQCKQKYSNLEPWIKGMTECGPPSAQSNTPMKCFCYHCPGTPKMTNVWEVLLHIFDGKHFKIMGPYAEKQDFEYFDEFIKQLEFPSAEIEDSVEGPPVVTVLPLIATVLPEPVPEEPTVPIIPAVTPVHCALPLFLPSLNSPTGTVCSGPTVTQLDLISSAKDNSEKFFENETKCETCNVDMTSWSIITVVNHAFSLNHLKRIQDRGGILYAQEFQFWIDKLGLEQSNIVSKELEYQLGVFGTKTEDRPGKDFQGFTQYDLKLISKVKEERARSMTQDILEKFGGCAYCDKWLRSAMEVIKHYTSEDHFSKVRERHPIKQNDVDNIMEYVKSCQKKGNKRCCVQ